MRITVPANKSTVSGTVAISLQLSAQVHQVNVFIDGIYLESTPPTTLNWDSRKVPNGLHEITAEAFISSAVFIGYDAIVVTSNNPTPTPKAPTAHPYPHAHTDSDPHAHRRDPHANDPDANTYADPDSQRSHRPCEWRSEADRQFLSTRTRQAPLATARALSLSERPRRTPAAPLQSARTPVRQEIRRPISLRVEATPARAPIRPSD